MNPYISKSKFTPNYYYLIVNFLEYQQFEITGVKLKIKIGNVFELNSVIKKVTHRYQWSRYRAVPVYVFVYVAVLQIRKGKRDNLGILFHIMPLNRML